MPVQKQQTNKKQKNIPKGNQKILETRSFFVNNRSYPFCNFLYDAMMPETLLQRNSNPVILQSSVGKPPAFISLLTSKSTHNTKGNRWPKCRQILSPGCYFDRKSWRQRSERNWVQNICIKPRARILYDNKGSFIWRFYCYVIFAYLLSLCKNFAKLNRCITPILKVPFLSLCNFSYLTPIF